MSASSYGLRIVASFVAVWYVSRLGQYVLPTRATDTHTYSDAFRPLPRGASYPTEKTDCFLLLVFGAT